MVSRPVWSPEEKGQRISLDPALYKDNLRKRHSQGGEPPA